jgi:NADH-quinone oxidoreductase subunit J
VLFLFVVMMLDITVTELKRGFQAYLPIGAAVGLVFLAEIAFVGMTWTIAPSAQSNLQSATNAEGQNTVLLGQIIYTDYFYMFQASGLVLLVAMIGAIVLTHRKRTGVKKQVIAKQLARSAKEAVELKKVETGRGI